MTLKFKSTHYDAIIIGGRCAGAATGLLMARNGAKVLIVEREKEPHDTLSTHALMRPAVSLLDQWGLLDQLVKAGTPVVRSTHFHYGAERVDVAIKPQGNAEGLYAPRRWLLDRVLRDAAVADGAELALGTGFVSCLKDECGQVIGASLRLPNGEVKNVFSTILIGADGRQSVVAESVKSEVLAKSETCAAAAYTYVDGLPNKGYHWYFGNGISAGLIPTTDGHHCLFTGCTPSVFKTLFKSDPFQAALTILSTWEPEIAADLQARGALERMRRFPGAPGHIRQCAGPGWALVGDAGYFKDPATAHGITDAFLDANRLAGALAETPNSASSYQVERDRFAPELFEITHKIAALDWSFDQLKTLHMDLNLCMKEEHRDIVVEPTALAA